MTEEVAELATAKDELYALSNKAQLGMQRAEHHDAEAVDLATGSTPGAREITELRARARDPGGNIEEIEARLAEIDGGPDAASANTRSRRGCRTSGARCWRARARAGAAQAQIASARASIARREAERAGATQRRDELILRVATVAAEETTAGERLEVLVGEERRMRDEIDGLGARVGAARERATEDEGAPTAVRTEISAGRWSSRRCGKRRTGGARAWRL